MSDNKSKAERELPQRVEDVANVLYYLGCMEPLKGCDFTSDERYIAGRYRLLEWCDKVLMNALEEAHPLPEELKLKSAAKKATKKR